MSSKNLNTKDMDTDQGKKSVKEIIDDNLLNILETRPKNPVSKFAKDILKAAGLDKNGPDKKFFFLSRRIFSLFCSTRGFGCLGFPEHVQVRRCHDDLR